MKCTINAVCIALTLNYLILSVQCFLFEYGAITALVAVGGVLYKSLECSFSECCPSTTDRNKWVPVDIVGLARSLEEKLHGQHLVKSIVVKALQAHFTNEQPSKALVMSFHGWTGGGKNYVARMIAENIYKKGMKSRYVHLFASTVAFPHEDKVDIYKLQIQDWIRGNVSECETSLFIFDEIDKMPLKMIDAIKPFIDYHDSIFGIDFRKSVFIFLSNTGSREIIKKVLGNWRENKERTDITYPDMEELVQKGAFNEKGGLHQSDLIQHSLIDFYVPFLPLERKHVELCIKDELLRRNLKPSSDFIKKVIDDMMFFPPENQLYSTKGCKSVGTKVGYLLTEEHFDGLFH